MRFIFNPEAEEFHPKAEDDNRHADSAMGTAWGGERLGIAWVSKHSDSEDESFGVGVY